MSSNAQPFWARLPFGRTPAAVQSQAVEDATLRSDRFRIAREGEWRRLDAIVTRIEKGRLRGVSDEDLLALPALYRTLASSLAVARETTLDAATIAYLEALAQRAWFIVYGPRASLFTWLKRFFGGGWGEAVRAIRIDVFIALATMVAGVIVGWLLVRSDVQWYYALVPGQFTDERVPGASVNPPGRSGTSNPACNSTSTNARRLWNRLTKRWNSTATRSTLGFIAATPSAN